MGYSPWDRKESDTTEATQHACTVCQTLLDAGNPVRVKMSKNLCLSGVYLSPRGKRYSINKIKDIKIIRYMVVSHS